MNEHAFLEPSSSPDVCLRELVVYIAYACMSKSLQEATIESDPSAIKHFHRSAKKRIELETTHPAMVQALKGVTRCYASWARSPDDGDDFLVHAEGWGNSDSMVGTRRTGFMAYVDRYRFL